MNLSAIREQRAAKVGEMRALLAKAEADKRALTADEQARFDGLKGEVTGLEDQEARAQFLADAERRMEGLPATGDKNFETECRAFSLTRAIAAQLPNSTVDAGREREVSVELARRSGRTFEGIAVPMAVFEQRVLTTGLPVAGPGSNLVATDHRGDLFIDILRAALRIRQLGATVLPGLTGNVDIPRLKASGTSAWVAENAALTAADHQFEKVSLTPKHVGALTEVSRNMIQQASPAVETLVRADFASILAQAIDAAAINGSGTGATPRGVLQTSGIGSVAIGANGGPITWASVIDLIAAVEVANSMGTGFLTNSKVVKSARKTLKTTGDTSSNFIMPEPNTLAGYQLQSTNLVPSNLTKGTSNGVCSPLIFGMWSDLLLGYWSELDVLVNPYESTAYSKGNVQVRAMATMDVQVRQPASFAAIQDLTTA